MTKKYRLKKDLPTHKAGALFYLIDGNLVSANAQDRPCTIYHKPDLKYYPNILTDWFEEIPEESRTVWDLIDGDIYYYIDTFDEIDYSYWATTATDIRHREMGNCFLTEEDAEKELARRKAKVILERDTKGFNPNWEDVSNKYEVYYDYESSELDTGYYNTWCSHSNLWFESSKDAKASIEAHPKEWKIYLGVEE